MPMVMCNSSATFSVLMNNAWGNLQWHRCLCYLYDIIIFGNDIETALENLISVFQSFIWTNLELKPGTCSFFQIEVTFLDMLSLGSELSVIMKRLNQYKIGTHLATLRSCRFRGIFLQTTQKSIKKLKPRQIPQVCIKVWTTYKNGQTSGYLSFTQTSAR